MRYVCLKLSSAVALIIITASEVLLAADPARFVISTTKPFSFQMAGKDYRAGMASADLERALGTPAKRVRVSAERALWAYPEDGVSAVVGSDGDVRYLAFNVTEYGALGKAASMRTDCGVSQGSSADDVTKALGKPGRREQSQSGSEDRDVLEYESPDQFLQFIFEGGKLCQIALTMPQGAAAAAPGVDRTFLVLTHDQVGFRNQGRVYRAGGKASEFEQQFGPPETKLRKDDGTTQWRYRNDGLALMINRDGTITTFEFGCTYDAGKPAAVQTDSGIGPGSSAREIVKAQGDPTHRVEGKMARFDLLFLQYDHADQRLTFCFKDGNLFSISIEKKLD